MEQQPNLELDYHNAAKGNTPVTCLGMTFADDDTRRTYFTEKLREKLQDPEFRKIEGFPIGTDEDILALSDPPYYTACPNPWIGDFIREWESQKPAKPADYNYYREPFAADVSEGKGDPIYNAHSYHTKVPHKAIMRYILHYTEPGDIVFDGFCGTGMTGVAAQMCGDRNEVMSLGYQIRSDDTILQEETGEDGRKVWLPFSRLGVRQTVLNDISPAAAFIAYNYNIPVDATSFHEKAQRILEEVEQEYAWMYETKHSNGQLGQVNYTIWSDMFVCTQCFTEINLWNEVIDEANNQVKDSFPCPVCGVELSKKKMERAWTTVFDVFTNTSRKVAKQHPALINYTFGDERYFKIPDENDLRLLDEIANKSVDNTVPTDELPDGFNTRQPRISHGADHVHMFFTRRNLHLISAIRAKIDTSDRVDSALLFWINAANRNLSRLSKLGTGNYFSGDGGAVNAGILGTLYIPSFSVESSVIKMMNDRLPKLARVLTRTGSFTNILGVQSSTRLNVPDSSLDYLFIDPPFGSNINYSELNFLWEVWLRVKTNIKEEAIENAVQGKGLHEYKQLMTLCFKEAYRTLKPGRWMTVEFSNTRASVWNSIQTALTETGFLVANVSALDKKLGSFKAVTTPTAVKQDLVISAYKPNGGFEERFQKEAQTEEGVWDFARTHLKYLPVTKLQGTVLHIVPERDPRILFDQMVAYYVSKGYAVPISSPEFQIGLSQRFIERDGMYFLSEQAAEYDRKKMQSGGLLQTMDMFVSDEASSIQWLRQLLKEKPQTFSDINPQFMQQLGGWSKNEAQLDLRELLNQNFLCYDGKELVPEQIHAYLSTNWKDMRNLPKDDPVLVAKARDRWYIPDPNKAGDLEKLRERALLKEFEAYKQEKKKLKVFRLEAVRAGFKKAWQERDYSTIVKVAEKIPNNVLEEDPKLLMWYDQATTRIGDGL